MKFVSPVGLRPKQRHVFVVFSTSVWSLSFGACPSLSETFSGKVVAVTDGDTIKVLHDEQTVRIRLDGIDAPEKSQAFGQKAKVFTSSCCFGQIVEIDTAEPPKDKDRYGRTIGKVKLPDGRILNNELVAAGLAWWYERYAPDNKTLENLQDTARKNHLGLWIDPNPEPPWVFRHAGAGARAQQKAASEKADSASEEYEPASSVFQANIPGMPIERGTEQHATAALQGGVQDTALQGHVQDAGKRPLTGRVNDSGAGNLNALSPTGMAQMQIVQFKETSDARQQPQVDPVPAADRQHLQGAISDTTQRPLRAISGNESAPTRTRLVEQPPVRQSEQKPERDQAQNSPVRTASEHDQRPTRESNNAAPVRIALGDEQAPQRTLHEPEEAPRQISNEESGFAEHDTTLSFAQPNRQGDERKEKKVKSKHVHHDRVKEAPQPTEVKPASAAPLTAQQESLLWDPWYVRINDLVCRALVTTMQRHGNPAGSNRVHITVWPDHRLHVSLLQGNNQEFDHAVLEAYRSLNGNVALEFPVGTQRTVLEYDTAHVQALAGPVTSFHSTTIQGDVERLP